MQADDFHSMHLQSADCQIMLVCVADIPDEDGEKQDRGRKEHKKQSRRGGSDVEGSDDDRSAAKSKQKGSNSSKPSRKSKLKGFALAKKLAYKKVFGWLDPKFKMNGKKLIANSSVVWRFMVSKTVTFAQTPYINALLLSAVRSRYCP